MSRLAERRRRTAGPWTLAAFIAVAVLIAIGYIASQHGPRESTAQTSPSASASASSRVSLPDQASPVSLAFDVDEGESVLVELSVTATYEASTGERRALYTIIGMSCGSVDGPTNTRSVSGTENLIHQNTRQLAQLISYSAESSGAHRCNAKVTAMNWDADYGDAELTLDTTIRVVADATDTYHYMTVDAEEPIVLESGGTIPVIEETFPLATGAAGDLEVLTGTHLTACTIENGSRDQTEENLCTDDLLDRDGTTVITKTVVEQLDGSAVCRRVTTDETANAIDHLVHHRLLHSRARIDGFTTNPCGDRIRVRHHVSSKGPAALVVHRSSTKAAIVAH